jgi:hypothetical protein
MQVRDYNGVGRWSAQAIVDRYEEYCRELGVSTLTDLTPETHFEGDGMWIYPVMRKVIEGAERGDRACIAIAVEFIEEDQLFPFGRNLKSRSARALRRADLSGEQVERIRERIAKMLLAGMVPREFREYSKLLRHIGMGAWWPIIEQRMPCDNPYAMHYFKYLQEHQSTLPRANSK